MSVKVQMLSTVTFCLEESFISGGMKRVRTVSAVTGWWQTGERLGGLIRSVGAAMPSGWRFEEDTWDPSTWTMSWGVTLNWDEPLFIPNTLLLFLFPISLLSCLAHLHSLLSRAFLYSTCCLIPTSAEIYLITVFEYNLVLVIKIQMENIFWISSSITFFLILSGVDDLYKTLIILINIHHTVYF